MEADELIAQDVDAAEQIVARIQDGLAGVMGGHALVVLPIEVAAVAIGVLVFELEQALLAGYVVGDGIDHGYFGIGWRTLAVG